MGWDKAVICEKCKKMGADLCNSFTTKERVQSITAQAVMLRSIMTGRNDPNDIAVANSIITKLLLSFDPKSREDLRRYIYQCSQINISEAMRNCPHSPLVAV